ncbi:MAG: type II toxin-antitoxin system RelE/ParE family toxin [Akkermansiaceae bacterium]|jgi:toxin ParE1/3/4|tara:strand:+ start:8295 stop:8600 length:306 start_codon:yes stop_codon:yes gene_type:complete
MLASRFHPDAREELLEAGQYILNDDSEEGLLFKLAFAESLDWACSQPLIFRCFEDDFRKVKVGKFRYSLIFRIRGDEVQVLAVAHMSRKPRYWKDRAEKWA